MSPYAWEVSSRHPRLQRRLLSYVNLYCNSRCNSRCLTCNFWQMAPVHLSVDQIRTVVESQFADGATWYAVQGGEFSLHPDADAILDALAGRKYVLFSNMLAPERTERLVRRHGVKFLTVSLDGGPQGYARVRGVDAFRRVTAGLLKIRRHCQVTVGITLTPWSTKQDLDEASAFCRANGIEFGVNIYTESRIYGAMAPLADYRWLEAIDGADSFCSAYVRWRKGEIDVPCLSIREVASIAPDGAVHLCHNQDVKLGTLATHAFDAIWGGIEAQRLQHEYASCNACWTSCYRSYDFDRAIAEVCC